MTHARTLRKRIEADEILVLPGAHDALTAKAIDRAGFDGVYMTGYGTSLSRAGVPDAGLVTMPEMVANANAVQEATTEPVLADADNGYGNATNVIRTVREYVKTGIGGIHIEDQTFPKRCGHTKGRTVIPKDEAVGKFRAATDVRDDRDEDFVIIARTDARGAVGGDLETAIDRVRAYVDAGADVAFVEGPADEAEVERIGEAVDAPLLYNLAGISPQLDPETLEGYGFDVVIYPTLSLKATMAAVYERALQFGEEGASVFGEMEETLPFDMHEFAGFPDIVEQEERYLPEEELSKYEGTLGADIQDE
jgi:2-methylisocitrate lyase-like PEP mutase family enzyme